MDDPDQKKLLKLKSTAHDACFYPECYARESMDLATQSITRVIHNCGVNIGDTTKLCSPACSAAMDNFGNTKCVFLALEVLPDQEKDKFWEVHDNFEFCRGKKAECENKKAEANVKETIYDIMQ